MVQLLRTYHYLQNIFLHPCVKKEPQILIDTTALLNKVTEINKKFFPFPAGTLLVSWDVTFMYPSIDNKVVQLLVKRL